MRTSLGPPDGQAGSLGDPTRSPLLYRRVVSAGFWTVFLRGATRSIGFVRNVILARLLSPEDFGLFGITLVVISMLDRFSNTGMQSAVVQKRESGGEDLDTMWSILVIRRSLMGLGLVLGASWIASFFEEPRVVPLFQVLGVLLFVSGFDNPGTLHFRRELEVRPQFVQSLGSKVVDLTVSIVLAFVLRSAWALMLGLATGVITRLVLSYHLHPHRPRFRIDWERARVLWGFGRWMFLNHVLFFLTYRGDNLVIGKFLGAPALGIYMLAYSIAEAVTLEISNFLGGIAFPAYSRIQGQKERVRRAFLTTVELVAAIVIPVAVFLCLLAEPITRVVLGERWLAVASVLPYLAVAGGARALVLTGMSIFNAVGRPALSFRMSLVSVVVTYGAMFPLMAAMGLAGVALAMAAGQLSQLVPCAFYVRRTVGVPFGDLGRQLIPAAALSSVVAVALAAVGTLSVAAVLHLVLAMAAVSAAYLLGAWILWKTTASGPMRTLHQVQSRFRGPERLDPATRAESLP